jgi:hypothetical protein
MPSNPSSNRHLSRLVTAFIWVYIFGSSANADTIFSDFGPGESALSNGLCVYGSSIAPDCSLMPNDFSALTPASLFLSPGNYDVTQIDVALFNLAGTNSAVISLYTAANFELLGSWGVSGQPSEDTPVITTISGISGIALTAGAAYYLEISPGGADTQDGWDLNAVGFTGYVLDSFITGVQTLPAFDVLGTPLASVPEPAPLLISSLALLVLVVVHRVAEALRRVK